MKQAQPNLSRDDYRKSLLKIITFSIILIVCLEIVKILLQWNDVEQLPILLRAYASFLLAASPYLRYFNATIVLVLGYFIDIEIGHLVYAYMRGLADHSSAATVQNIAKIVGFGILLAILASIFSVDPATALTLGGFGGIVVGFATQTFLSNAIAGVFVLVTRPFTFGDVVTMAGNSGTVKEIRVMHLVMESLDGSKDIMIPNSLVLSQVILKNRPGLRKGLVQTEITIDPLPDKVPIGTRVSFTGRLCESETGTPLVQAAVRLFDRDIGKDDLLAEAFTNTDGRYYLEWAAKRVDVLDGSAEVYVRFEGDDEHMATNSKQFVIEVTK